MPDDKKTQNNISTQLPPSSPTQPVASGPKKPIAVPQDEQASLDELAKKLEEWKKQVSEEEPLNKDEPKVQEDVSTDDVKEFIPGKGLVSSNEEVSEKVEATNVPEEKVEAEKPVVEQAPAGLSINPEDIKKEMEEEAVEKFEQDVEQASSVISSTYPKDINELLRLAQEQGSSDLHITVGYPPIFRVDGKLIQISKDVVTAEDAEKLIFPVLAESKRDLLEVNREVDVAYELDEIARFRVNVFHGKGRLSASFRLIPTRIKTLEELNLPKILRRFTKINQGFVLITGPTGHGKTTTLAALLQEINKNYEKHIITIEDPIEYVYTRSRALVSQREMHEDTHSWEIALRSAMRQDPDVVLVGEMRDYETISSAITLAETGHLVFATLHTNSASQTIDRIIDAFPESQQRQVQGQLASIIEGVVCQRLIPVRTGGRRPACEIMLSTAAIRNLIREGKIYQIDNVIRTSLDVGMTSMENSLVQLVREGLISVEQAEEYATDPEEVIRLLR